MARRGRFVVVEPLPESVQTRIDGRPGDPELEGDLTAAVATPLQSEKPLVCVWKLCLALVIETSND